MKAKKTLSRKQVMRRRWYSAFGGLAVFSLVLAGAWFMQSDRGVLAEAPEAKMVLDAQAALPFQVLIPAYMPRQFDRSKAEIKTDQTGPSGEPSIQVTYRTAGSGVPLYVREWLAANPELEVLYGSRLVETKWGKAYLLSQGGGLIDIWVTIGPLRISLTSHTDAQISREDLLEMANTLGPASNQQVFYYAPEKPVVKDAALPPPEEIKTTAAGVQEFTLVITPGGYSPMRFSLKKGVPAKMTFRQLGQVGCGNTLIFPSDIKNPTSLQLKGETDKQVLEWTPQDVGDFQFYCSHYMFRGIMTVRP